MREGVFSVKKIAEKKGRVIITTDHGMIRVQNPIKIVGDRNTNTNLRYKQGKNLNWDNANKIITFQVKSWPNKVLSSGEAK